MEGRVPARPIGLARIGVAAAILLEAADSSGTLMRLTDASVLSAPYFSWMPPVTAWAAAILIGLWLAATLAFMLGIWTRIAGAVLVITLASVLVLDQQLYSNHLYLMTLAVGLLTLADAGAAWSLDARRTGWRETVPSWPASLLKLQVSIVYGFAALAKINLTFLSGSVVASYLRREGPLAVPADWRTLQPMMVLSVLAILLEAFVAVGLWSPRWRPAALVAGLTLHIGITAWLTPTIPLLVFSLLMLPLYLVFMNVTPARVVVWDDACSFCGTWVRWFRRLDWLAALRFVPRSELAAANLPVTPEEADRALQLVSPAGRVHGGFAAVTRIAELLPVSFLWAPLMRFRPIARAGERAYVRVASRRTCLAAGRPSPSGAARAEPTKAPAEPSG